jgi:hypothetical protein
MMMADFSAAQAAENFLCGVRASAVLRIRLFVVDPRDEVAPRSGTVFGGG